MNNKIDRNGCLIAFCGGSGSGKSYYEKELNKLGYAKYISHTTRDLRVKDNEQNGVDYYFVSFEEFDKTEMIETTKVGKNNYGLSVKEFLSKDNDGVVVVDPNGVEQILEKINNVIVVLIDLPLEIRINNMINRGDTQEQIEQRLANEDYVGDFYKKGLKEDILITEMLDDIQIIINKINDIKHQTQKILELN